MNYESLIDELTCKLGSTVHLLHKPKNLPCCSQIACNNCIVDQCLIEENGLKAIFYCKLCNESSKIRMIPSENTIGNRECDLEVNVPALTALEKYTIDLNHYMTMKLNTSIKNVEGKKIFLFLFSNFLFKLKMFI